MHGQQVELALVPVFGESPSMPSILANADTLVSVEGSGQPPRYTLPAGPAGPVLFHDVAVSICLHDWPSDGSITRRIPVGPTHPWIWMS